MAPQAGLEPATYCLEGSCSVQLSYWGANTAYILCFFEKYLKKKINNYKEFIDFFGKDKKNL